MIDFQECIKNKFKQMWTFVEVFFCGNKFYIFNTVASLIFS